MEHVHQYDQHGKQICCKADVKSIDQADALDQEKLDQHDGHDHDHDHHYDQGGGLFDLFRPAIISFILLLLALSFDHFFPQPWFDGWVRIAWYLAAYLPVGFPVVKEAFVSITKKAFFSEFLLMTIATVGAFAIGEYPEGVAVMLFYSVGEIFQALAVKRAKGNIKSLLDQRPDEATVIVNNHPEIVPATSIAIGSIIQLKPGEKLALDGKLISEKAAFNTAALTGESKPNSCKKGDTILAGMINLNTVSLVEVTTAYSDSKLSKVLELVQNATGRKAPSELFIRRFAKKYTPIVVALAAAICLLPFFIVADYQFNDWLYRALVFLVISCPCALVISIPLGYFGGIGAASRNGILFKGGNFLDKLATIQNIVLDKTGTMTEGVFEVQEVKFESGFDEQSILQMINALESKSTHPVAAAIHKYVGAVDQSIVLNEVEEIPGHGMRGMVAGKELLVGNLRLLDKFNIIGTVENDSLEQTLVAIAYDKKYVGYISIADRIKEDARVSVDQLKKLNVKTTMLSGDKKAVVAAVARQLGIAKAFGDLLPEDKVQKVEAIKASGESVAFVGDGVNDAPVIALSDVGIAMGGLGSDAAIETADVVIQNDQPQKIPMAINIGKQTKKIVWQNVWLAFGVKAIVLILGAGGLATMWEAVFADVGVALLAILNAVRIQRMKF